VRVGAEAVEAAVDAEMGGQRGGVAVCINY
jgi:hypothetical protein